MFGLRTSPNPLPGGEGTDWGILEKNADVILMC